MTDDRVTIAPILPADLHQGCRVVALSDVGRVREENQDYMGYFRLDSAQLLVIADGMGGHSGGYEASRIVVDTIRRVFVSQDGSNHPADVLAATVREANASVRDVAAANAQFLGMGSTVVMALVVDGQAWFAHVGDSRAYLLRGGGLRQMTVDHSRVNRMIEAGLLAPEAAEDHPMGHILERSVGCADDVEAEVSSEPLSLQFGDRIILCSDGLWGTLGDSEIRDVFGSGTLQESVERAIGLALVRGADDNTTVGALELAEAATHPGTGLAAGDTLREMQAPVSGEAAGSSSAPSPGRSRLWTALAVACLVVAGYLWWSGGDEREKAPDAAGSSETETRDATDGGESKEQKPDSGEETDNRGGLRGNSLPDGLGRAFDSGSQAPEAGSPSGDSGSDEHTQGSEDSTENPDQAQSP